MLVQGLGLSSQILRHNTSIKAKAKLSTETKCDLAQKSSEKTQNNVSDREELLKNIKGKIKNGFYNSDAVAEDLSHGFAKAFDESV